MRDGASSGPVRPLSAQGRESLEEKALLAQPLFAFFGNGVSVVISARVADARLAQQLSGLFVLPLVGLAGGQFAGWLKAGVAYYAALGAFVLLLNVGLVIAARRLFDRERMMSR